MKHTQYYYCTRVDIIPGMENPKFVWNHSTDHQLVTKIASWKLSNDDLKWIKFLNGLQNTEKL